MVVFSPFDQWQRFISSTDLVLVLGRHPTQVDHDATLIDVLSVSDSLLGTPCIDHTGDERSEDCESRLSVFVLSDVDSLSLEVSPDLNDLIFPVLEVSIRPDRSATLLPWILQSTQSFEVVDLEIGKFGLGTLDLAELQVRLIGEVVGQGQ